MTHVTTVVPQPGPGPRSSRRQMRVWGEGSQWLRAHFKRQLEGGFAPEGPPRPHDPPSGPPRLLLGTQGAQLALLCREDSIFRLFSGVRVTTTPSMLFVAFSIAKSFSPEATARTYQDPRSWWGRSR